jgi:hypothetical protein
MHPQITSADPGECPICHMDLEPIDPSRGHNHVDHDVWRKLQVATRGLVSSRGGLVSSRGYQWSGRRIRYAHRFHGA